MRKSFYILVLTIVYFLPTKEVLTATPDPTKKITRALVDSTTRSGCTCQPGEILHILEGQEATPLELYAAVVTALLIAHDRWEGDETSSVMRAKKIVESLARAASPEDEAQAFQKAADAVLDKFTKILGKPACPRGAFYGGW
jgi:hypothetical protein